MIIKFEWVAAGVFEGRLPARENCLQAASRRPSRLYSSYVTNYSRAPKATGPAKNTSNRP